MAKHSWRNLHKVLFYFVAVYSIGIFIPVTISTINGNVTPYVPYISEGGGFYPQAGIFTTFIVISSIISQIIMIFRYLLVEERCSDNKTHIFLNKIGLIIGTLCVLSFIMVGAFPTTFVSHVHNVVAGISCISCVLYMFCHTWISLQSYSDSRMNKLRLAILIFSFIAIATMAIFGGLGSYHWNEKYWPGSKTPQDEGFVFYVVSAASEWILAILFFLFYTTFYHDFKGSTFYFQLESAPRPQARPHLVTVRVGQ